MKVKNISFVAMFAALTAIGAFIKIPIPYIPFTLQIVAVYLSGALLGARLGFFSQLCYIAIGLVGVPVFADGGGFTYVLKPSFGYLLGYAIAAFVGGLLIHRYRYTSFRAIFLSNLFSLFIVYLIGCAWLYMAMKWLLQAPLSAKQVIVTGFLLPVPGDLILCLFSTLLIMKISPQINRYLGKENKKWAKPSL
ncbi:Belongs to BioY family protein [Fictibacillus macauensis ZFHKF-1]|uniref:Biotin transporter n=1 Tax=Fictibacillus macauensis ZFHKF-1 TaxID=1196324 RepID=I8ALL0_9BACL|nr:biotin transporter BioY [Fictibacillus macauensis]EIT86489.1 Belongs to BioY family protein [Fictibacillus macauensis ZFHKF-1]